MSFIILAINPGSTSTKIAMYENDTLKMSSSIEHSSEELEKYDKVFDQFEMRKEAVLKALVENNIDIKTLSAVVGRGGTLPPVKSGAYKVNDEMLDYLENRAILEHASNLGAAIANSIAKPLNIDAFIYDSVAVDEMEEIARVTGIKGIERSSTGHALNTRAMALKYAKDSNKDYEKLNLIVAHVGGGATIYLHEKGRMVDMISDDEGPFSPQRSGRVPGTKLARMCFSGDYTQSEIFSMIRGKGGIVSHLNTADVRDVEMMIEAGDEKAKLIYDAMIYQIAKGIGEMATVVNGDVDTIIVTGGIAYSKKFTSELEKRVKFISHVEIMPGENELESLAYGVLRVLKKEESYWKFKEN